MRLDDKHLLRCVQKTGTQQVSFDIPSEPSASAPCVSVRFAFALAGAASPGAVLPVETL